MNIDDMKYSNEHTLIICDEALSGTNGAEAVPIAEDVLTEKVTLRLLRRSTGWILILL